MSYMMELLHEMQSEKNILLEDENDGADNTTSQTSDNSGNADNNEESKKDDNNKSDDDFSLDTDLSDASDDITTEDDTVSSDANDYSSDDATEDEVNQTNTDMFATLSSEEQKIKIKELKRMYNELYNACNESLTIINNIKTTEQNSYIITNITGAIQDLKQYIFDYLVYSFPVKSYVENDIMFNRFLYIVKSISVILEKYTIKIDKDNNNS